MIPWPSYWCSPAAVDPATAPTTSTASCHPASAGHQHPAGHVGELVECERVEILAGAGTLACLPPLHAAQPLQLLDVPASAQPDHQHPAGHVGEPVEILASAGTLAGLVPLHAAQPLKLLDVVLPSRRRHAAAQSIGWPA